MRDSLRKPWFLPAVGVVVAVLGMYFWGHVGPVAVLLMLIGAGKCADRIAKPFSYNPRS